MESHATISTDFVVYGLKGTELSTLSVSGEAPVIGSQPENVDVERGGNATLSVKVTYFREY